jgi:hypothetical protein
MKKAIIRYLNIPGLAMLVMQPCSHASSDHAKPESSR